jgi:hypothetical protein
MGVLVNIHETAGNTICIEGALADVEKAAKD